MDNLVRKIRIELIDQIENDQLSLQLPADFLREIRQMAQDPSIANNKLATLIAGDAELKLGDRSRVISKDSPEVFAVPAHDPVPEPSYHDLTSVFATDSAR